MGDIKSQLNKRDFPLSQTAILYIRGSASVYRISLHIRGKQLLSYIQLRQLVRRISTQLGIHRITSLFRHTIITEIYEENHDANTAVAIAGRSNTTITTNCTAHARQEAAVKGIKALDEVYSMRFFVIVLSAWHMVLIKENSRNWLICDQICDKTHPKSR